MRNIFAGCVVIVSTLFTLAPFTAAQTTRPSAAEPQAKPQPFDPHDLSGVWILSTPYAGISNQAPPLTAWGQAKFDANKPSFGPRAVPPAVGNDVIGNCDPTGFPRNMFSPSRPVQFIQLQIQHEGYRLQPLAIVVCRLRPFQREAESAHNRGAITRAQRI